MNDTNHQDGVVAATGHENGDVLLWGIQWNEPLSYERGAPSPGGRRGSGGAGSSPGGRRVSGGFSPGGGRAGGDMGSISPGQGRWSGGGGSGGSSSGSSSSSNVRKLKLLRVLNGAHKRRVTFVRVCAGGREMLVGDAAGEISRWQCIRLDQLTNEELNQLV